MADENFRVRKGLTVGESAATIDAATGDIVTTGDLAVNGGDITTSSVTANIVNTTATTVNIAGAATTVEIGAATGTTNVNNDLVVDGTVTINGSTSGGTTLSAPATGSTLSYVLPGSSGAANTVLTNDGSGNLTWALPGGGGSTFGNVTVGVATDNTVSTTTGNLVLDSFSDIITVDADTQLGTNKSIQMGTGVYSSSTDIWRNAAGTSGIFDGIEISNGGATATTSALVLRQFGQSTSGGVAATPGLPQIFSVASRGTQASPLAVNAGQNIFAVSAFTNLGDTTGGGTGAGYSNDVLSTSPAGIVLRASENHRQSLQATFTANTSGTTLTVTAMTSGTIVPGQQIRPTTSLIAGVVAISRQLTSTEVGNALGGAGTYALTGAGLGTRTGQTFNTFNVNTGSAIVNAITPPGTAVTGLVNAFTFGWDASSYGTGILTTDVLGINTPYSSFPQRTRTVTAITGGNTLTVTGHGLTTTGAIFVIAQAGNPNGLTTNLAYYVDTIVDANNITLRTNSVSGGAVTGLTNGTGLFLQCEFYAQNRTGANNVGTSVDLYGYRGGNVVTGPSYAANKTNDYLGQFRFNGSTGAAFPVGNVRVIGQATQDWTVSGYGSQLLIQTTKNTTLTPADTAKIGLNSTTFTSDSFLFENSSGTDNLTIDSSGNVAVTGNLTTTGDIRVNGGDIQNPGGTTAITLTSSNTATTIKGDTTSLVVNGGADLFKADSTGSKGTFTFSDPSGSRSQYLLELSTTQSVAALYAASTDGSLTPTTNYNGYRRVAGVNAPTQTNDRLGQLIFNGNTNTGTGGPSAPVTGGEIRYYATENWTGSATGTAIALEVTKTGTTTNTNVFISDAIGTEITGDTINFKTSAGAAQTSAGLGYTRTYGEFAYTNAAGFAIAAQNTIYTMPLDTTLSNSGVTISGTGEININVSGWYKIIMSLQITLTVSNQPGQIDFWLRKNAVDVPNSKTQVDLLKDQKAVIAMDWLVNSDGNDYWEIVYVGTSANYADIDFPTIAATTTPYVSPVAPALLVNVIPAGA